MPCPYHTPNCDGVSKSTTDATSTTAILCPRCQKDNPQEEPIIDGTEKILGDLFEPISNLTQTPKVTKVKSYETRASNTKTLDQKPLLVKRMGTDHVGESNKHVKYYGLSDRSKYEVKLGMSITRATDHKFKVLGVIQNGAIVDTFSIKKSYRVSEKVVNQSTILASFSSGGNIDDAIKEFWAKGLIWVILHDESTNAPKFYTHVCKQGKFHHSSFAAGKSVLGAGEWVIEDGKLVGVSANSGHYKPDMNLFLQSLHLMAAALTDKTMVLVYKKEKRAAFSQWVHVPWSEFKTTSAGYSVSPG